MAQRYETYCDVCGKQIDTQHELYVDLTDYDYYTYKYFDAFDKIEHICETCKTTLNLGLIGMIDGIKTTSKR